jgi:hypothetical protein
MATGVGEGFSAFIGLSEKNYMWIATLDPSSNNLVNEQRIQFNEGDVLILPFGTVHAGDRNRTRGIPSYKVFTEIYTIQQDKKREKARLDSRSQLWIVEGEGFIRQKQPFQLGTDRCLVPHQDYSSKKRKRIDT